jgi:hypothetical protein
LRMVTTKIPNGGNIVTFHGKDETASFVRAMSRPGRRVTGFYTPNGYITTNGTMMR